MEAILKRFDDAVKELLSHPRVVVTHYRREVAASETEINRLKGLKSLCRVIIVLIFCRSFAHSE